MHDAVDVAVVGGHEEGKGGAAEGGAVDEFGVAHNLGVEEGDGGIGGYEVVSGIVNIHEIVMNRSRG